MTAADLTSFKSSGVREGEYGFLKEDYNEVK